MEPFVGIKVSGHQIVKNTPQFAQMIFYRCTGQGNAKIGRNLFDCFCSFRGGIFDKLCFINDLVGEGQLLIQLSIPAEQIIGCDENGTFLVVCKYGFSFFNIPCYGINGQFRCKMVDFPFPVVYKGCRADNQCIFVCLLLFNIMGIEKYDNLKGFSESHIISKNPTKTVLTEGFQPQITGFLVFTQYFPEFFRYFKITVFHCFHISDQLAKTFFFLYRKGIALPQLFVQIRCTKFWQSDITGSHFCRSEHESFL